MTAFAPFARVWVPIGHDLLWSGVVLRTVNEKFCAECHCGSGCIDGSTCCPGPWYEVSVIDPDGKAVGNQVFAEHEIEADAEVAA